MKDKKIKRVIKEKKPSEVEELKNQLARALADYDNLRKRAEEEKKNSQKVINAITIGKLIVIWDSLVNLQKHLKDQGLDLVLKSFREIIFDLGGEEIEIKAQDYFNPLYQEAIEVVDTKEKELDNKVAETVSAGWKLRNEDFVIRPTKVKVYKLKGGEK